jgi:hypothetical protein
MASSLDFLQGKTIHGQKPRFPPSCKSSWPQSKLSFKLQVFMALSQDFLSQLQLFMAFSQDFLKAATINGLKPRFPQSCKSSWPETKISSKLQVSMA